MDYKRSVEITLALSGEKKTWLAKEMGISRAALGERLKVNNPTAESVEQTAKALKMKSSELIAMGEM